jgi:hypothetical protein
VIVGGLLACVAGVAEDAGEDGDRFEQQGVDAGLLVGGAAGAEFGDRAAVLGLAASWRTRAATAG